NTIVFVHLLFFFFQAEDGIRDFHVTGVQTCALPISLGSLTFCGKLNPRNDHGFSEPTIISVSIGSWTEDRSSTLGPRRNDAFSRSEERRVGKGCRSGWGPGP